MKINLFCFPFAGGSKYSYAPYIKYAPPNVKVIAINYPGRGGRFQEKLSVDLDAIVDDAYRQIKGNLHNTYAFYGHSMGTVVAYLLTKRIVKDGLRVPIHLFVTGRAAPSIIDRDAPMHRLPKDEFLVKLKELGGSPDEVLNDGELMNFFEPILRADFEALENYHYADTEPFDIPITVMTGLEEEITLDDARSWAKETTLSVDVRQFPGKHFFIFDHPKEIMKIIGQKLLVTNVV
jgi:surfactin synthase thioesterase subunit